MNQKNEGIYDARGQLGWPKTIVLGFQHMFAMFGATVLVPRFFVSLLKRCEWGFLRVPKRF